jgi:hypothetical protein
MPRFILAKAVAECGNNTQKTGDIPLGMINDPKSSTGQGKTHNKRSGYKCCYENPKE